MEKYSLVTFDPDNVHKHSSSEAASPLLLL